MFKNMKRAVVPFEPGQPENDGRYGLWPTGYAGSQRSLDCLRSHFNDAQQYPSGTVGDCPPLFPLLNGAHAEAELLSKLDLREPELVANRFHIRNRRIVHSVRTALVAANVE
jgi:hypothetical protein